jgi:tRNA-dihydrouridine synthase A
MPVKSNSSVVYTSITIHIAPMLDVTNREFRQLMRILSKRCILWTEMVVDETIVYTKDLEFHLEYERESSHPIICQLRGNHPDTILPATQTILEYGYDEVNINMDCPCNRVSGI